MEEVGLRFSRIDASARGFEEIIQQGFEKRGFLNRGVPKQHIVVHKLLVGNRR